VYGCVILLFGLVAAIVLIDNRNSKKDARNYGNSTKIELLGLF